MQAQEQRALTNYDDAVVDDQHLAVNVDDFADWLVV